MIYLVEKLDIDQLDIDKLETVPVNLNNFESKINRIDVGKLKTVLVGFKKLSDVVDVYLKKQCMVN